MKILYQKSELAFSLCWIGIYVLLLSVADSISATLGTQKLFFEELCERTLATRAERLNVLAAFEEEVLGGKRI